MAGEEVGAIKATLSLVHAGFMKAARESLAMADRLGGGLRHVGRAINQGMERFKLAGAVAGGAFVYGMMRAADAIEKTADASDRLGLALPIYQGFALAANEAGVKTEQFDKGVQRLSKSILDLAVAGKNSEGLTALGLDASALAKMGTQDQLRAVADGMAGIQSQAQRARIAAQLFGEEAGPRMALLLAQGSDALDAGVVAAQELGIAMSRVDAEQVKQAGDAVARVQVVLAGLANRVLVKLAPIIQGIAEAFLGSAREANGFGEMADHVSSFLIDAGGWVASAWQAVQRVWLGLQLVGGYLGQGTAEMVNGLVAGAQWVGEKFSATWDLIKASFGTMAGAISVGWQGIKLGVAAAVQFMSVRLADFLDMSGRAMYRIKGMKEVADGLVASAGAIRAKTGSLKAEAGKDVDAAQAALAQSGRDAAAAWDRLLGPTAAKGSQFAQQMSENLGFRIDEIRAKLHQLDTEPTLGERYQRLVASSQQSSQEQAQGTVTQLDASNDPELALLAARQAHAQAMETEHQNIISEVWRKGLEERREMSDWHWSQQASNIISNVESITRGVATHNKAMFRINQIAGIAEVGINTARAAAQALAAYPPPLSFAMAGLQTAAGVAQANAIRSATYGGGGGRAPSTAGSGGGIPAQTGPNADGSGPGDRASSQPGKLVIPRDVALDPIKLAEAVNEAGKAGFIFSGIVLS